MGRGKSKDLKPCFPNNIFHNFSRLAVLSSYYKNISKGGNKLLNV